MKVEAPIAGSVEWCCEVGQQVASGAALGWVAGPGRCGLVPVVAPGPGVVTWRWSSLLPSVARGEVCVVLGHDAQALAAARLAERSALLEERRRLDVELTALASVSPSALSTALLAPQRAALARRAAAIDAALRG